MSDVGAAWTEARIEALKRLWSDGVPAGKIADELGGVTRDAVIGKAHRLMLGWHPLAQAKDPVRAKLLRDDDIVRVALVDLTSRSCRWPIGDPRDNDFGFCGQPIVDGKTINEAPYCARHMRRAMPA